jgi:hypothetical protein
MPNAGATVDAIIEAAAAADPRAAQPDFAFVKDKRMSELTPAQREDAHELWLRQNVDWMNEYHREHYQLLLRRLDQARGPEVQAELPVAGTRAAGMSGLHPVTANLVDRFAAALKEKLAAAEKKYGYGDGWADPGWMDECRAQLIEHVAKGDPRDVAAYCAFLWHHGKQTVALETGKGVREALTVPLDENAASLLRDTIGSDGSPITLSLVGGPEGQGLYVWLTDYPEEGSIFLAASPPRPPRASVHATFPPVQNGYRAREGGEAAAESLDTTSPASAATPANVFGITDDELRLMAGEMTAGELRTVRAVLKGLAARQTRGDMNAGGAA